MQTKVGKSFIILLDMDMDMDLIFLDLEILEIDLMDDEDFILELGIPHWISRCHVTAKLTICMRQKVRP